MQKIEMKIYGRSYQTKDGRTFTSYSYTKDGKEFFRVKFAKECKMTPKDTGYIKMYVDKDTCSIQKGDKLEDGKVGNRTIWIHEVLDFAVDTESNEEAAKRKLELLDEIF